MKNCFKVKKIMVIKCFEVVTLVTCSVTKLIKIINKKIKMLEIIKDGIITMICILKLFSIQNYTKVLLLFFNL